MQDVTILRTSVLINVGLMYRSAKSEGEAQSWSISTSRLIHFSNSDSSKAWRTKREVEKRQTKEEKKWGEGHGEVQAEVAVWRQKQEFVHPFITPSLHSFLSSISQVDKLSWQSWTCGACWASVWRDAVARRPHGTASSLQTPGEKRKEKQHEGTKERQYYVAAKTTQDY